MSTPHTLHYLLVLDRSGSMSNQMDEVLAAVNHQILTLQQEALSSGRRCRMTVVSFDSHIETVMDDRPIGKVTPLTYRQIAPRGMTALIDACVSSIDAAAKRLGECIDGETESIAVVIYTDGGENASTRYNLKDLKTLIANYQELPGWDIAFIGADPASFREMDQTQLHPSKQLRIRKERSAWAMREMSEALAAKMKYMSEFFLDDLQAKEDADAQD